ncbi:acyl-CoA thioesterase [Noviherbaspirillum sp. ST9]|uniref:acyl-CoA thioesterase n=1 Tax=Noviherbaspirillum sp. ST9 TaxID=3401606 RepID=UPI003B58889F
MKDKPWRREQRFYSFSTDLPTRYADMDTERHVNNVAVLTLHAEARSRLHLALFGRDEWLARTHALRPAKLQTDFLEIAHYPGDVAAGVSLVSLDPHQYTLAIGLFQDGACVGLQECRIGHWHEGAWTQLPALLLDRLQRFGLTEDVQ